MAVSIKLGSIGIDRDLAPMLQGIRSPEARSAAIADAARQAMAEAQAANRAALGRDVTYEVYVDGRRGGRIEDVRPDGTVVVEYDVVSDLLGWIAQQLEEHSPVGRASDRRPGHPGLYKASHVLTIDGQAVSPDATIPLDFDEAVFVNVQPYSRKLEKGASSQAAEGVYQVVAYLAQRRFSNVARIGYGFRSPLFGAINEWAARTKMRSPGRTGAKREDWLRAQPAIVVRPR